MPAVCSIVIVCLVVHAEKRLLGNIYVCKIPMIGNLVRAYDRERVIEFVYQIAVVVKEIGCKV